MIHFLRTLGFWTFVGITQTLAMGLTLLIVLLLACLPPACRRLTRPHQDA